MPLVVGPGGLKWLFLVTDLPGTTRGDLVPVVVITTRERLERDPTSALPFSTVRIFSAAPLTPVQVDIAAADLSLVRQSLYAHGLLLDRKHGRVIPALLSQVE